MLKGLKGKKLSIHELQALVSVNLGSNEKTIDQALRTMGLTGLIKDIGNSRFKVL